VSEGNKTYTKRIAKNMLANHESGKLNENVAPLPSALFSAPIIPPWASTIPFEIYNPNPDPVSDLVANLEINYRVYQDQYQCLCL
jgi:hypothetical protein